MSNLLYMSKINMLNMYRGLISKKVCCMLSSIIKVRGGGRGVWNPPTPYTGGYFIANRTTLGSSC